MKNKKVFFRALFQDSYKILEVGPEGLVFTSKARAINELAEIGGRQHEIAALIDMFKLVAL